jgi:hypothetical protein
MLIEHEDAGKDDGRWSFGSEYEGSLRYREDFELDPDENDDLLRFDQELKFELSYQPRDTILLSFEVSAATETELYHEDDDEQSREELQLDAAWVFFDQLLDGHAALQIGRQEVTEPRQWWWDADLDALRFQYERSTWQFELGIAEQMVRKSSEENFIDPEQDDVMRVFGRADWEWRDDHRLSVFALYQDDHSTAPPVGSIVDSRQQDDETDARLLWLGLRADGGYEFTDGDRINYWLDSAIVRGDEIVLEFDDDAGPIRVEARDQQQVRGWGYDLGASWTVPRWPGEPTITLAYAYGSGDSNLDDGTDRNFRQTGLHANENRFAGVNRFNYYGELLQPELSNLSVFTAAIGFPLFEDSSLELVYHRYRQVEAADFLRDGDIDADPAGDSRDIGQELDLTLGFEEWDDLELELTGSLFEAGAAYGAQAGEQAFSILFKLNYSF